MTEPNQQFATTQWTLVRRAVDEGLDSGRPALEELIRRYWHPVYAYARRRGYSREDAEDATQEFLSRLVHGDLLRAANPAKGKFRTFLLTAWKRFLVDEFRRQKAVRRGRDANLLSIDFGDVEQRWLELESREGDSDRLFALSWATALLEEARQRLKVAYSRRGRDDVFCALMPQLTATLTQVQYQQLAAELSLSPSAVKVALHRLRQRFGQTLREIVLETLDDREAIDAEISELLSVLSDGRGW